MPASALLVWDFDGTLADTFLAIQAAAATALVTHGQPVCDDAVLRGTIGLSLAEAFTVMLGDEEPDPELVRALVASYRQVFDGQRCSVFPGVAGLLTDLDDRGLPSAIATSRYRPVVEHLLTELDLARHFADVQSTSDLPPDRGKPHPDVVLAACAALDRRPGDAVVIGDAPVDIGMGRAAGATTIAVTWGYGARDALVLAGPTHVVDTLDELRAVLDRRG
jgi:HAD superfamily hydrolase (TIGR01509 family)